MRDAALDFPTPQALATFVDGYSEDDIDEIVWSMGTRAVLKRVFEAMRDRFRPERAPAGRIAVQWLIAAPSRQYSFWVESAGGSCDAGEGVVDAPRVTLRLALVDLFRLAAHKLDALEAVVEGRIQVEGDLDLAEQLPRWFGE